VHYEAPPSSHVPEEMDRFIKWFKRKQHQAKKASNSESTHKISHCHLHFETIHPFEDAMEELDALLLRKRLSQGAGRPGNA